MSSHAQGVSRTGICVSGRGNPASNNHNRILLSRGDSAPPSIEWEQFEQPPKTASSWIPHTECLGHRRRENCLVPHQRVEAGQRLRPFEVAPQVESRADP